MWVNKTSAFWGAFMKKLRSRSQWWMEGHKCAEHVCVLREATNQHITCALSMRARGKLAQH